MTFSLLYIADPMCSWCWGFSPVLDAVREHFGREYPVGLLLGGLRPGTTDRMSEAMKADIKGHWQHVHRATGQPFDLAFFDRKGYIYDTEPACRAVVAVRRLEPEGVFAYLKRVQEGFYASNRDVTAPEVLADIAAESGLDRGSFASCFQAEETIRETWRDFETSRRLGVAGFPCLLAGEEERGTEVIAAGYRTWEDVKKAIEDYAAR